MPKPLFVWSKTFFDESKAWSRRFKNSPFGLLTVGIAHVALRQDSLLKNVLMTAQRDSALGKRVSRDGLSALEAGLILHHPETLTCAVLLPARREYMLPSALADHNRAR